MKLKFLAKTLEIYSTVLQNKINVSMHYGDEHDFDEINAKRLLSDFPNDFIVAHNIIIHEITDINNALNEVNIVSITIKERNSE